MRAAIRFLLGWSPRELTVVDPTMTVLDYLRRAEHRVGTKEGCAEGDCGACTVVLVRPEGERLRYEAINACIRFVGSLDGCQVLTVEDLKSPAGALHPVQAAMAEANASQCGFCTPGFVMSLLALYREGHEPTRDEVNDRLAGNLCRCTGYGPIVDAALRMRATPGADDHIRAREPHVLETLRAWDDGETVRVQGPDGRTFWSPAGLDDLAQVLARHPEATVVAGATDVGLWVTKQRRVLDPVVWLGRVRELQELRETDDAIEIGAGVSYTDAFRAITRACPDVGELLRRLGSVQIRNAGTIGGNVANGSPIGDSPPFLIAAGATLHLRLGQERRSMPLEDFFIAYGQQDRRPGEVVERVTLPKPAPGTVFRCYKISKRFDQDISAVCAAFRLRRDGEHVAEARLAFGGMAATPKRAAAAEAALVGRPWNRATVEAAMAALPSDFTPLTDWRASAEYRMRVARNLLLKCFLETERGDLRLVGRGRLADAA